MAANPVSAAGVNWNHPLARGLQFVALRDQVFTRPAGRGKYTARTTQRSGLATATTAACGLEAGSSVSFVVVADLTAASADAVAVGRVRYNASANYGATLRFNGGNLELDIGAGTSSWFYQYRASTVTVGRSAYGASWTSGTLAASISLYKDAVALAVTGDSGGTPTVAAFDALMDVGQGTASGATAITGAIAGTIEVALYYSSALTAAEMAAVHEAALRGRLPFLYQSRASRRRRMAPAAVGGGTSLTLADASHAHAADNIVLTTSTTLAVADCTHSHAVDNVALVVGSVLTVAEATHSHAADALTLTTDSTLAVAEATHAHAADAVALTTDSTLAVAEATHAHAADNVTLSIAGATNLTVADATHAHTVDALALTSAHALIVADSTHSHTVDGLTLTAASVLAIQEALHAHAADGITLDASGAPTLLLADALHAHTSDGVALTVAAWLTVADALHGHAADNVVLTIPGAYIEGNPRVWLIDARRHYTAIDARNRVVHLS